MKPDEFMGEYLKIFKEESRPILLKLIQKL
jgi:hypothetical protein